MKNNKRKIIIWICILIIVLLLYLLCDYNNILTKQGINISNINSDLLGIFVNSIVVVGLYMITYFLLDKKNIETRENQEQIIKYMLSNDYKHCLTYIRLLSNENTIEKIKRNIKGNVLICKDEFFINYINLPFENYDNITDYAIQGIVSKELLERYYYIKRSYKDVVTGIVHFSDMEKEVTDVLNEGKNNLIAEIEKEIEKLKNQKIFV